MFVEMVEKSLHLLFDALAADPCGLQSGELESAGNGALARPRGRCPAVDGGQHGLDLALGERPPSLQGQPVPVTV
jgi:hypothetical protein